MNLVMPILAGTILVVLIYIVDKYTPAGKLNYTAKQVIIGILFGCLAIYASEHGIALDGGVLINVRDAAPLSAGLIFGAPAGVISGLIGGGYRFFFGAGDYTRIACTVATILAGLIAALLRTLMFDDKKPNWAYGAGIAFVCEDIHMLLIFILHFDDSATAFDYVQAATIPMVLGNAVAIAISLVAIAILNREKLYKKNVKENIAQTFQRWLVLCIVIAFIFTSLLTYRLQSDTTATQITGVINQTLEDVSQDILDLSSEHLLAATEEVREKYTASENWNSDSLLKLARSCGVAGINVFGADGIITNSSRPDFIGYNMNSGTQSAEFMRLFTEEGMEQYVQEYQPLSYDENLSRKYAAVLLPDGTALQVGYSYEQYKKDIDDTIYEATKNRHIGNTGFVMITDSNWLVVADGDEHNGMHLSELGININTKTMKEKMDYSAEIHGNRYLYSFLLAEGYCIIGAIPETEAYYMRDVSIYVSILLEIIIFAMLFVLVYFLIKQVIIKNLHKINGSLAQITNGNLDVTVNVRSNAEFASLSDDINSTVSTLKDYIAEAAARVDQELEYAKEIQCSSLPTQLPQCSEQEKFDICAKMYTAKEVGGDFYDYYLIDDRHLVFLIADVSGKGIPAALFMMTAKTTLKDLAERGLAANEVFEAANEKLCEGNEAGMFVTACMGILDLKTGQLQFANAGHNPPLVKHRNGDFEYLRVKPGLVLAGMEGVPYRLNEYEVKSGDRIFFYTDGVTEATNAENQLYGEQRLKAFADSHAALGSEAFLDGLKEDIDSFVGEAPQFDDITMLIFDYFGGKLMEEERTFPAKLEALQDVQAFYEEALEAAGCPMKTQIAVSIAIEEVFVNIAHYAYVKAENAEAGNPAETAETASAELAGKPAETAVPAEGEEAVFAGFCFEPDTRMATFELRDNGIPFDPLSHEEPDITLSADERDIGGLGILITRKTMDSVEYSYENGQNVLTMKKKI